jgi:hypothetical protein
MNNLFSGLLTWSSFVSKLCSDLVRVEKAGRIYQTDKECRHSLGRSFIHKAMNRQKIKEVMLVLLFIAACGFAGADSGDFKEFVITKAVALFLLGIVCIEGKGLWSKRKQPL